MNQAAINTERKKNADNFNKKATFDNKIFECNPHQRATVDDKEKTASSKKSECEFIEGNFCKLCQLSIKDNKTIRCHVIYHINEKLDIDFCDITKFDKTQNENPIVKRGLYNILITNFQDLSEHLDTRLLRDRLLIFTSVKKKSKKKSKENIKPKKKSSKVSMTKKTH